jgi:hypothetical protein
MASSATRITDWAQLRREDQQLLHINSFNLGRENRCCNFSRNYRDTGDAGSSTTFRLRQVPIELSARGAFHRDRRSSPGCPSDQEVLVWLTQQGHGSDQESGKESTHPAKYHRVYPAAHLCPYVKLSCMPPYISNTLISAPAPTVKAAL